MLTNIDFQAFGKDLLPDHLAIEIVAIEKGKGMARMPLKRFHFAPNGYVHAGSVLTLADTIAGYACVANLPEGSRSFTTMEIKSNFLGSLKEGVLLATAVLEHGGKTTQLWDVVVSDEATGKKLALFRCTQMIFY
jgi:1,4-dihydroxy-2-naphthoyl-CoA hydrolase